MSGIKDFKTIADEIMNGINADEALKAKTLRRCERKPSSVRKLVPAAAFAVIAAAAIIAVTLLPGGESDIPNIMMASESPGAAISVQSATVEDAKAALGAAFLMPSVTPEGFSRERIDVINESGYVNVTLQFADNERTYLIIEEKSEIPLMFDGYNETDINGTQAFVMPPTAGETTYTEVHWIKDGVHYTVTGALAEDDALNIARSMK